LRGKKEKKIMRNIAKFKRSVRAISPVISVLLMIAIAVVAALVAYAWVMGYMGNQTDKAGKGIQLQSFTTQGNLVLYVQNTGQGTVHLKYDGAVYVNDVLKNILLVDNENAVSLDIIPIVEGQTRTLVIDYVPIPNEELRIKIVTMEGTFIQGSGTAGQQSSTNATLTFVKDPITSTSAINPTGTKSYFKGSVIMVTTTEATNEVFQGFTSDSSGIQILPIEGQKAAIVKINAVDSATITGHFASTLQPRLEFNRDSITVQVNTLSDPITVTRQDATGQIIITLDSPSGTEGFFDNSGNPIGSTLTLNDQVGSATFRYKSSTTNYFRLTASATGYVADYLYINVTPEPTLPETSPTPTTSTEPTPTPTTSTEPTPTPTTSTEPTPTPTTSPTPTPTPTPNPQTVVFNTGFDGNPWDQGWNAGDNPPFYQALNEGVTGASAKSDPYSSIVFRNGHWVTVSNYGAFTSNEVNTNLQGATAIQIEFKYKVHQTNSASDLKIAYATIHNPDLSTGSNDFDYVENIGRPILDDKWYSGSFMIVKPDVSGGDVTDSGAFTQYFSFRFESNLRTGAGGVVEQVWVDDVKITVIT